MVAYELFIHVLPEYNNVVLLDKRSSETCSSSWDDKYSTVWLSAWDCVIDYIVVRFMAYYNGNHKSVPLCGWGVLYTHHLNLLRFIYCCSDILGAVYPKWIQDNSELCLNNKIFLQYTQLHQLSALSVMAELAHQAICLKGFPTLLHVPSHGNGLCKAADMMSCLYHNLREISLHAKRPCIPTLFTMAATKHIQM